MRIIRRFLPFIIILNSIYTCKNETQSEVKEDTELKELFTLMQGSFDSKIESKIDSSYYNISLHMYPICEDKGHFIYAEQALNSMQNKPNRQRIYEVTRTSDSTFSFAIYKLDVNSLWIGKWKIPKAFDSINLKDIALKEDYDVVLKRISYNHFMGKTGDASCVRTMHAMSLARSEVEIFEDKIMSWNCSFDAIGKYLWRT